MKYSDMKWLPIALPPQDEQAKIAAFLDHETAKIDALIAEQQRLIELLQEKRQAVISHAVTKGLNPSAPMKASCVAWLGEVPKHWYTKPIKYIAELTPPKSSCSAAGDMECSFIPMERLKTDSLDLEETRVVKDVIGGYTYFEDGDVLFAKVTPCFENRNAAVAEGLVNGVGFGSSEIFVLRPLEVSSRFLFYRLLEEVLVDYWTSEMTGAGGLRRVPSRVVENYIIAVPPPHEAEEVVTHLDTVCVKYQGLISEAERAVNLLSERRKALISAAVTGKIDVRSFEAPCEPDWSSLPKPESEEAP